MQSYVKNVIVSFIDAMQQVQGGTQEHYVEVMEIPAEQPNIIQPTETPIVVQGKFLVV